MTPLAFGVVPAFDFFLCTKRLDEGEVESEGDPADCATAASDPSGCASFRVSLWGDVFSKLVDMVLELEIGFPAFRSSARFLMKDDP